VSLSASFCVGTGRRRDLDKATGGAPYLKHPLVSVSCEKAPRRVLNGV
jgi:hypothetical protein